MTGWHGNRYVRLGIGSVAVAVAFSLAAPPSMASAAAVRPKPGGNSSPKPQRDVSIAKRKTTPGPAAGPRNPSAGQAPSHNPAPAPARQPRPQRKDRPPDRSAHKSSPQTRASAPDRSNNIQKNKKRKSNRKKREQRERQQQQRQAAQPTLPGANSRAGGVPQAAGTPSNVLNDLIRQFFENLSKFLSGQQGQQVSQKSQPGARKAKAVPDRPSKPRSRKAQQGTRKAQPGTRKAAPARPSQQARCGKEGCLTIVPSRKKPKPQRPKVRALDNRKVTDKAEEELRKWREANENQRQQMRQKYADQYNGPGEAIVDWCARFVTYVYVQAGVPLPDMQGGQWDKSPTGFQLVKDGATWAKAHPGWWHPGTKGVQPGDIVIYNGENHTGVVTRVYEDGSFDTVEGNTGGGPATQSDITKVHHSPSGNSIEGRIRPPAPPRK